jgi:hypothetical protein
MTNTATGYRTPASHFDLPPAAVIAMRTALACAGYDELLETVAHPRHCERSEAIQGRGKTSRVVLDCFVALLLAMTVLKHRTSLFRVFANVVRSHRDPLCDCTTGKSRRIRENLSSRRSKNKSLRENPKSNLK